MRSLRAFFAMVALVAVALLPGPLHALAAASVGPAQMHVHADHRYAGHHRADGAKRAESTRAERMATAHHHGSPAPCLPCKTCSFACCAPVTAAVSAPLLAAIEARSLRRQRPEPDLARQGATSRPALRPPAFRSA